MNRPVIIGASVCGLLLVGIVSRPSMWSSGGSVPDSTVTTGSVAQAARTATPLQPARPVAQLSGVELHQESEILWHRALELQENLHQERSQAKRDQLLDDFEQIVARYNAVQERLED